MAASGLLSRLGMLRDEEVLKAGEEARTEKFRKPLLFHDIFLWHTEGGTLGRGRGKRDLCNVLSLFARGNAMNKLFVGIASGFVVSFGIWSAMSARVRSCLRLIPRAALPA